MRRGTARAWCVHKCSDTWRYRTCNTRSTPDRLGSSASRSFGVRLPLRAARGHASLCRSSWCGRTRGCTAPAAPGRSVEWSHSHCPCVRQESRNPTRYAHTSGNSARHFTMRARRTGARGAAETRSRPAPFRGSPTAEAASRSAVRGNRRTSAPRWEVPRARAALAAKKPPGNKRDTRRTWRPTAPLWRPSVTSPNVPIKGRHSVDGRIPSLVYVPPPTKSAGPVSFLTIIVEWFRRWGSPAVSVRIEPAQATRDPS